MLTYTSWRTVPKSVWVWKNFSPQEIACRGTGRVGIVPDAMDKLQALRVKLGKPLTVNSGYRSPEHNRNVGGAIRSAHMTGTAFDISMANHDPEVFIAAAREVGFTGIGTYPASNFVHVDIGAPRSWGKPFPKRAATPGFATEAPRQPETVREDPDAAAAVGVIGGGGVLAAAEYIAPAGGLLGQLAPAAQIIAIVAVVVFGGFILWRHTKGRR